MSLFKQIFAARKPVIGMIALPPLLGYPEFPGLQKTVERALQDLESLQQGGVDGVCIENDYDRPHQLIVSAEVVASFTRVAAEVAQHASVPVGLQVLLNDWRASLSIARVIDAKFVRLDFFVDKVRINAGIINPQPDAVVAFQKQIGAESIALFTDIQVKYSELLEPEKTLATSALQAIEHGSSAVVVSGTRTGEPPLLQDLREVRDATRNFPVLIGSGTTPDNVGSLFSSADGAIVGTSFKEHAGADAMVIPARVKALMNAVRAFR